MSHSNLFGICVGNKDTEGPYLINIDVIKKQIANQDPKGNLNTANLKEVYANLCDLLREVNDAQFGIDSGFDKASNIWFRHTENALPLEGRYFHFVQELPEDTKRYRCSYVYSEQYGLHYVKHDGTMEVIHIFNPNLFKETLGKIKLDTALHKDDFSERLYLNPAHMDELITLNSDHHLTDNRIPHNHPVIEANNTLLRCLSRLRPIDFVLQQIYAQDSTELRLKLNLSFSKATEYILQIQEDEQLSDSEKLKQMIEVETDFNTDLIKVLHAADLTQGCYTQEDAEKLLSHYRILSSFLDPARTIENWSYDEIADMYRCETYHPVTKKTEKQKESIQKMKKIQCYPLEEEKNCHNVLPIAMQKANQALVDLIGSDDTAAPDQARKIFIDQISNAYVVKNEWRQGDPNNDPSATLWLARTGSPVYIGPGESKERVLEYAKENIEQLREAVKALRGVDSQRLHFNCLNTYSPVEGQMTIIDTLYEILRRAQAGDDVSYIPLNLEGTLRTPDFSSMIAAILDSTFPLQRADRLNQAADVALIIAAIEEFIHVNQCASGKDRTGGVHEKTIEKKTENVHNMLGIPTDNIETTLGRASNGAEIPNNRVYGAPGFNKDSIANNHLFDKKGAFSPQVTAQFYRDSSNKNKKSPVRKSVDFLKKPGSFSVPCEWTLATFKSSIVRTSDEDSEQYKAGMKLASHIEKMLINAEAPRVHELDILLKHCTNIANAPNDPKTVEDLRRVAGFAQKYSKSSDKALKVLGILLLTFVCLTLVTAGVLAAIPTGGSSMLVAVIGASGLGVVAPPMILAGAGVLGMLSFNWGRAREDLLRSVNFFQKANPITLDDKGKEEEIVKEEDIVEEEDRDKEEDLDSFLEL